MCNDAEKFAEADKQARACRRQTLETYAHQMVTTLELCGTEATKEEFQSSQRKLERTCST